MSIKSASTARFFKILAYIVAFAVCAVAFGDIECRDTYQLGEQIVVKVLPTSVPDGSIIRGSIQVSGKASYWQPDAAKSEFGVWADSGTHVITAKGLWVKTDTGALGGKLEDMGWYEYTKTITVGPEVPPPPFPFPDPKPNPELRRIVILEETAERTPKQAQLWLNLLQTYPSQKILILDKDLQSASKYLPMADKVALPALIVLEGDKLIRALACPASASEVAKEVAR